MQRLAFSAALLVLTGGSSLAGDAIRSACLTSGRPAATRELCTCIQQVADLSLTAKEQRLAASFYKDPHKAQEVRQSDRRSDEEFWQRYKAYGEAAEAACSDI